MVSVHRELLLEGHRLFATVPWREIEKHPIQHHFSFPVYTQGICTHSRRTRRRKRNQLMKRPGMLRHLFWLGGIFVLLAACTSLPAQSAQASPSPAQPAGQLKPNTPIPASCPATPVNIGGPFGTDSPWLQAQPTSSGIVAYLAYSGVSPSRTYRLAHTTASSRKKDCTPRPSGPSTIERHLPRC